MPETCQIPVNLERFHFDIETIVPAYSAVIKIFFCSNELKLCSKHKQISSSLTIFPILLI